MKHLSLDMVYDAQFKLRSIRRKTDLIESNYLPHQIYLKTENLQKTGSFKVRGAYYKIQGLTEEERSRGVLACSAGNHAQGVALAAQKLNTKSMIFMPEDTPLSKVEATKAYGGQVVLTGDSYDDAYRASLAFNEKEKMTFIHPFDDVDVIAGQGTVGLEVLEDLEDLDGIVVPVGGGGLLAGIAYVIKKLKPQVKVYGVEAQGAASMKASLDQSEIKSLDHLDTFADGVAVKRPGDLTFPLVQAYVDQVVTVNEDEIASALLTLMEKQKLVTEGSGALAFAACMYGKIPLDGKKTVVVLSGGNIDVNILHRVIRRGLIMSGRNTSISLFLTDKPGELYKVAKIISDLEANVIALEHNYGDQDNAIRSCVLNVKLETRDQAHMTAIRRALVQEGFTLLEDKNEDTNH